MTRARLLTSWVLLLAGVVALDAANDARWTETLAGVFLAASWIVATGGRR